ncbi:MAG: cell division protein FtsZ [Alphaproteobacteria bacterium]|nr:cell division protein FtsZ [Alphaproteobacteria bacterium]
MTINLTLPSITELKPRITVVGVGGAGGNAVNNMINANLEGVDFVVCNTDAQSLSQSLSDKRIQLGIQLTQGLGAGSRPDIGRAAAEEATEEIREHLQGSHMVFITGGMGGGTGTGAGPIIAQIGRECGALTVGVVTKPFHFEGAHRMSTAESGIQELQRYVDTLIIIPNQNLFRIATEKTTFAEAFKMADNVLYSGVRGVTDLMVMPGLINLDFADIRTVMMEMGKAMMGTGESEGEKRAIQAAEAAISNPLLDDVSMKGARGILINITGGPDMTLFEVDEAANRVREEVDPNANIIFGSTFDPALGSRMRVSIVATGIGTEVEPKRADSGMPTLRAVIGGKSSGSREPAPAPAEIRAEASVGIARPSAPQSVEPAALTAQAPAQTAPAGMDPVVAPAAATSSHPMQVSSEKVMAPMAAPAPIVATPERTFIPPAPKLPISREPIRRPNPFAEAAVENAGKKPPSKPKGMSLFERMTSITRRGAAPEPQQPKVTAPTPTRVEPRLSQKAEPAATAPLPTPAPAKATEVRPKAEGLELRAPAADEDLLEIPTFLRRQAN